MLSCQFLVLLSQNSSQFLVPLSFVVVFTHQIYNITEPPTRILALSSHWIGFQPSYEYLVPRREKRNRRCVFPYLVWTVWKIMNSSLGSIIIMLLQVFFFQSLFSSPTQPNIQ